MKMKILARGSKELGYLLLAYHTMYLLQLASLGSCLTHWSMDPNARQTVISKYPERHIRTHA
jgi:hypothetical protein